MYWQHITSRKHKYNIQNMGNYETKNESVTLNNFFCCLLYFDLLFSFLRKKFG